MYTHDSFFTLSGAGQIGLIIISAGMAVFVFVIAARLMRQRRVILRIGVGVTLYALFVWLSPQGYYTYYRMIFDGLPAQWVIGWPPFTDMVAFATFTGPANLSAHSQGALFWALILLTISGPARRDHLA